MGSSNIRNLPSMVAAGIITKAEADKIRKKHKKKKVLAKNK